jgi:hypothetical protein
MKAIAPANAALSYDIADPVCPVADTDLERHAAVLHLPPGAGHRVSVWRGAPALGMTTDAGGCGLYDGDCNGVLTCLAS